MASSRKARSEEYQRFRSDLEGLQLDQVDPSFLTGRPRRKSPHNCYRKALDYAWAKGTAIPELRVIHGVIFGMVGHAWIELPGNVVFDGTMQQFYDRDVYYRHQRARVMRSYTMMEANALLLSEDHYGPYYDWREREKVLTGTEVPALQP